MNKKAKMKIMKSQKKLIAVFLQQNPIVIDALPASAISGFSRGVAEKLGISYHLCFNSIEAARSR